MCCCSNNDPVVGIVASTAVTNPTAAPVVLTADGEMPNRCEFTLCIPRSLLVNCSTALVTVTAGSVTYNLMGRCGRQVRWDQLVAFRSELCDCGSLKLYGSRAQSLDEPATIHLGGSLPATSYQPAPAATPAT